MNKLKQWCRRVWCWLTGGHRYKDINLVSYHSPFDEKFYFGNHCIKCGKFNTWKVPAENIFGEVHRRSKFYVPLNEEFKRTMQLIQDGETHLDNIAEGFFEADRVIFRVPTVDAVKVKHGRWVEKQEPAPWDADYVEIFYQCSSCESRNHAPTDYCPDCGAKMDGERQTNDSN